MATIRIGIGGWDFAPWRGSFYPAGLPRARALEYASRALTSIEINGTFYRHQTASSFAAWAAATPEDFVFAVKAHRATTHGKVLADAGAAIDRFLNSGLSALGPKMGPILWQFPPTRKFDSDQAAAFLRHLPPHLDGRVLRHAIEARHPSFDDAAWISMLRAAGVASVIVDSDKQALRGDRTADFCYLRLQRNTQAAPDGYDAASLDAWADRLLRWRSGRKVTDLDLRHPAPMKGRGGVDCFVYFIGGDKARAPDAARAMIELVQK
jgi:uncharacterized protein YecE (DUF72 family)